MGSTTSRNIVRFIIFVLIQVLVLKRIQFTDVPLLSYTRLFIYPMIILLMPMRIPQALLVIIGFSTGIIIDIFYDSLGVHAAALTFTSFIRTYILGLLEPRGGYNLTTQSPTKKQFGNNWFLSYILIMYALHLFFYFSVEAFTFVYIVQIILNTLFSYIFSLLLVLVYTLIFDPTD